MINLWNVPIVKKESNQIHFYLKVRELAVKNSYNDQIILEPKIQANIKIITSLCDY